MRHGPPSAARCGGALQRRGRGRHGRSFASRPRAATDGGGAGGAGGPDPARSGHGAQWHLQLDASRPLPGGGRAVEQVVPPGRHVARGAAPGLLSPEGSAGVSAVRPCRSCGVRKKGLHAAVDAIAAAHPGKRITIWFQDGQAQVTLDRMGQKGRICYRWWLKGQRPPGLCGRRFECPSCSPPSALPPATAAR